MRLGVFAVARNGTKYLIIFTITFQKKIFSIEKALMTGTSLSQTACLVSNDMGHYFRELSSRVDVANLGQRGDELREDFLVFTEGRGREIPVDQLLFPVASLPLRFSEMFISVTPLPVLLALDILSLLAGAMVG